MALTPSQLATLKADMDGTSDPTLQALIAARDWGEVASWYNQQRTPDYHIYVPYVSVDEIQKAINLQNVADITATDSDRVIKLLQIRSGSFASGEIGYDGRVASDRSAWADVFSAAGGAESDAAIAALWTELASNSQHLFRLSTGTGADAANADTSEVYEGITLQDILNANQI